MAKVKDTQSSFNDVADVDLDDVEIYGRIVDGDAYADYWDARDLSDWSWYMDFDEWSELATIELWDPQTSFNDLAWAGCWEIVDYGRIVDGDVYTDYWDAREFGDDDSWCDDSLFTWLF